MNLTTKVSTTRALTPKVDMTKEVSAEVKKASVVVTPAAGREEMESLTRIREREEFELKIKALRHLF